MGLIEEYKPTIVAITCQLLYAGLILIVRAALLQGLNSMALIVYRQIVAFLLIAPLAYFTRRETTICLGWKNFWLIFLLSFVGVTCFQNAYNGGLYLASSSAASAMYNLIPAITFVMAYILRMEKLQRQSLTSLAKITGTMLCVAGAGIMAVFKGPNLLHQGGQDTWLLGCLVLFASTCCWSLWLILQVPVYASYPHHLALTAWMCLISAIQSGILTLIFEQDIKVWKLNSALDLICCLYSGVTSAITFLGQAWVVAKRGPVFTAMFNPLSTAIVTVFSCVFMQEELYAGRAMGELTVIIGLYIVLWGKSKDNEEMKKDTTQMEAQTHQAKVWGNTSDLEEPLMPEKPSDGGETSSNM